MFRRKILKISAWLGACALMGCWNVSTAQQTSSPAPPDVPIRILMGGYGPPTTSFSLALKRVGDRLTAKFGDAVDVKYVYNIMDVGYRGLEILTLVENGVLTLGYQSSSYMTDRVPELGLADMPFLFSTNEAARAAMDGDFGRRLAGSIEAEMDYRILGYFENGFRHISNRVRPIRTPSDLAGLKIRVLPSEVHARTFELLGAEPQIMDLTEAIAGVQAGTLDAQENPFANTVTYGVHEYHRFHTETSHFYLSRPIFLHRPTFDSWPEDLQTEMRAAIKDAVVFQRELHVQEEVDAAAAILAAGGEILRLDAGQLAEFEAAVALMRAEAQARYSPELLELVGL